MKTSVNTTEVYTKYYIGKYIVEYEQSGNVRAEYGKRVLQDLSWKLIACFEGGWSVDTLEKCRKLFLVYSKSATRCGFWDNLRMKFQTFFFHGLII